MEELQDALQAELLRSLDTLFKSKDYSDFKIICESDSHRVHKAIVFPRSEYFAASQRFGGKEAKSAEITLHDDEPEHVEAMVYYFYHLDYLVPGVSPDDYTNSQAKKLAVELPEPSKVDESADENAFEPIVRRNRRSMEENEGKKTWPLSEGFPCLVFHAKMYALGDKYNVKGLKVLAKERFSAAVQSAWQHEEFSAAIRIVFETTLDTDKGLREPVVNALYEYSAALDRPEVEAVVKDIPGLAYELLTRHRKRYFAISRRTSVS